MAILVTGGAGYIGSVVVEDLIEQGEKPVVLDNLVYGHRKAIDESVAFYEGDIGDKDLVSRIVREHDVESCMHFSAFAFVGESVEKPQIYYGNNFVQTLHLLDVLIENNIKKIIFSSTCATYGEPQYVPIDEKHPQFPTSPYGWSKFMVERALIDYNAAYGLKYVAPRYFNACGATEKNGEHHEPETHLIPLILQVAQGKRDSISIFGDDYSTPDGTAIRDYIHVSDLSQAHILALEYLRKGGDSQFVNLGIGGGYSVAEVIEVARKVTGKNIEAKIAPRRPGDPSHLVADAKKAREVLGWNPQFPEIEAIIESAWAWHQSHPNGYDL
ncbi:MAG: UDP-glucose 4-epimerase GalE [Acidobacteria bacterium]|nr:UDP-glucose 4-epimerase GalE [Acidobacteriota bacterium]MCA1637779.1 UDP-glucose 4-epimerase GalE [Acidobacteriota bacterium]